jgi:uncharacterized protein (TIGR00369 family)
MSIAETQQSVERYVDQHGLLDWLGATVEQVESGRVRLAVDFDERLASPASEDGGYLNSGTVCTLVDAASTTAVRTIFDSTDELSVSPTNANVSYLRPATDDIYVEAEVVRAGGAVGVTQCTVATVPPDSGRQVVAIATTTFRLFRGPTG